MLIWTLILNFLNSYTHIVEKICYTKYKVLALLLSNEKYNIFNVISNSSFTGKIRCSDVLTNAVNSVLAIKIGEGLI